MGGGEKRKERMVWVDILRVIAIALIVLFHIGYELEKNPALRPIGFAGASLFFIISGFVLAKIYPHLETFSWEWLKGRYLKVASLYYPALIAVSLLFGTQAYIKGAEDIVLHMLFLNWANPEMAYSIISPAWFIVPLMAYYIAFPFLNCWLRRYPAILPVFFLASALARLAEGAGVWTSFSPLFFIAEFCFGIASANNMPAAFLLAPLLVAAVNPLMALPFFVFYLFSLLDGHAFRFTGPFAFLGRYTFEIFLFHEAVIMVALGEWSVYGQGIIVSLAATLAMFALVMGLSSRISEIIKNNASDIIPWPTRRG